MTPHPDDRSKHAWAALFTGYYECAACGFCVSHWAYIRAFDPINGRGVHRCPAAKPASAPTCPGLFKQAQAAVMVDALAGATAPNPKCECGGKKVGFGRGHPGHSTWCDWRNAT